MQNIYPYQIATLVLAIVALLLLGRGMFLRRKLARSEEDAARLEALTLKATEILASAPDGLFLWDHSLGGIACSRRLAVILGLEAGTLSRFDDIRECFEDDSSKFLEQAIGLLKSNGTPFDILLRSGDKHIQAIGSRAETAEAKPVADLVWMRDVSDTVQAALKTLPDELASTAKPGVSDQHLARLLNALSLPVWIRDESLALAFVNEAGQSIDLNKSDQAEEATSKKKSVTNRMTFPHTSNPIMMEMTEIPLAIEGVNAGTVGYAIDRTRQEMDTARFLKERADQNNVLENLGTAIAIFDQNARLTFSNTAYAKLWALETSWLKTGPTLGEIFERLREQRSLPEVTDFKAFKTAQLTRFKSLRETINELLHLPDGRTVNTIISPHGGGGLVFTYEDDSDRLNLERSFRTLDAVQRETLDNLHEGIIVIGPDGRLKLSNPIFARVWHLNAELTSEGTHITEIVDATRPLFPTPDGKTPWSDESWKKGREKIISKLLGRQASQGRLTLEDGTILDYANIPLPDGAMMSSYIDVTDSSKVEQALRQRALAYQEADRLKSEFIANVSFEVRTPLTSIIGFADMLRQNMFGELNSRQLEYADSILGTSKGLLSVIGNILDLASIEAGKINLDYQAVNLHELLSSVIDLTKERIGRKELNIEFQCSPEIGAIIVDETRIKQVIFNLISNAITYTPPRGAISLKAEQDTANTTITITDTGIGIPTSDHDRLVQPFEKGKTIPDVNSTGEAQGVGLGLTIVKKFVELHGGNIEIKSSRGRGTTITCQLPNKPTNPA